MNLHALLATFFRPGDGRTRIVADALNFPSDLYALQSQLRLRGLDPVEHLLLVETRDGRTIDEQDVLVALDRPDVALAWLPSVLCRSGQLLDIPRLAAAARARGVTIGFDCAHSVGSVPHHLHDWGVDFAVWCTYKYLNAGPGAVGSLYVHERHHALGPGLAGWWGSDKQRQFDMDRKLTPAATAGAWQIGTPSVLGAAALYGLGVVGEAGVDRLRAKSLALTGLLIDLADRYLYPLGFEVGTPRNPDRRGGHVALEHPAAGGSHHPRSQGARDHPGLSPAERHSIGAGAAVYPLPGRGRGRPGAQVDRRVRRAPPIPRRARSGRLGRASHRAEQASGDVRQHVC